MREQARPGEAGDVVWGAAPPGAGGLVARPELWERLGAGARVTMVSAPPGSGKTVLLRSWLAGASQEGRAAWVPVGPDERDPQRFWLSVVSGLRRTGPGSVLVRALTAAPDLDGWAVTERLLTDLAALGERLWLVVDDVHELAPEALRQLELLIMRAPPRLRFVLAARHDVRLGLHRLRLEGELAEIRADDLRFSLAEAAELFAAAGAQLPGPVVAVLHERTEGWAAGLRLAALSLAGHPDAERLAAGFSGSERTVAEYLLAEVLDRQPEPVRRLLLRTSILNQVNGELADLLTGATGGERMLQDLEHAGAFVVPLDPARSWFRYHRMFAGLLQLELRRTAPDEVAGLHRAASQWLAAHGSPAAAIRHAQAAGDWEPAARLLAGHWPGLHLDGQDTTIHELLAAFPAETCATDAELAAVAAADELARGSLAAAGQYLDIAERETASVPKARQGQAQLLLGIVRLLHARQRGDLPAVAEAARRLEAETSGGAHPGLGDDLRALALVSLGTAEFWAGRFPEAGEHMERGVTLARTIGRPYLELNGLAYQAAAVYWSFQKGSERGRRAVELAEQHGWAGEPAVGVACTALAAMLTWQARLQEAERWIERAERATRTETEPAAAIVTRYVRGALELARGRNAEALAALSTAERLARLLAAPTYFIPRTRALTLHAMVRLGELERAEQALAGLGAAEREHGEIRIATATLRLAQGSPQAAADALAPVLAGPAPVSWRTWMPRACLLEAMARDALGEAGAAEQALERALDLAESNSALLPFLLHPVADLLQRHSGHRTAHAGLVTDILALLAGTPPAPSGTGPQPPLEPLSDSELRVLRYLPTNLTAPEIAGELSVSPNTIKTHMRNLYAKLGTHRRTETVTIARDLGLLAPTVIGR
jgi:LuxR family maltose regulon positive regulatory protein